MSSKSTLPLESSHFVARSVCCSSDLSSGRSPRVFSSASRLPEELSSEILLQFDPRLGVLNAAHVFAHVGEVGAEGAA